MTKRWFKSCSSGSFGKIVIGTQGASYEQLITDGVNGFLMKRGSAADLYRSVCRAMDLTETEKKRMGILAQKRIEKMKPEVSIKNLLQYYDSVCRERLTKVDEHIRKWVELKLEKIPSNLV